MSTITKEFTKEQLQQIIETDHVQCGEASSLARIALASLEAEAVSQPIMFIDGDISSEGADKLARVIREFNEEDERPLAKMARIIRENPHPTNECDMPRNAPAPVSVPAAMEMDDDFDSAFEHGKAVGWNAYRAAMLQSFGNSEQLNSPVIPDGWVACSERMPEEDGNYWGWWSESKRQGPVWFIKSELQAQFQSSEITHWMPLPAAPQQEVK
ncbi:DUF551 domain-containing protein [Enterobacter hormaechei]